MATTSFSLLQRLRSPEDEVAWNRFVDLYTPLLYYWLRRTGLQQADAVDVVQEVFALLLRKLPEFSYDGNKSFRGWLRMVTLNKCRELGRRRSLPVGDGASVEPEADDELAQLWDAEYHRHLAARALEVIQESFEPTTWKACWETIVHDRPPAEVAAELGITVNAVYLAKSRVLRCLRQELDGLWE